MKCFVFTSILIITFFQFNYAQHKKVSYTSFKKVKSVLEAKGYKFSKPYTDNGPIEVSSLDQAAGRSMYLFYNKDTLTQLKLSIIIKDNRDKIEDHFPIFLPIINTVDSTGGLWIRNELFHHNSKQKIEKQNRINNRYYILTYYPDYSRDLLNVGIFYKDPGFNLGN